jgi:hypothetical protein
LLTIGVDGNVPLPQPFSKVIVAAVQKPKAFALDTQLFAKILLPKFSKIFILAFPVDTSCMWDFIPLYR